MACISIFEEYFPDFFEVKNAKNLLLVFQNRSKATPMFYSFKKGTYSFLYTMKRTAAAANS